MKKNYFILGGLLIILIAGISLLYSGDDTTTGKVIVDYMGNPEKLTVYFFWGENCPHCLNQKPFLEELDNKYPHVEIKMFETYKDSNNVKIFEEFSKAYGIRIMGVPTTFIGDKYWVGFTNTGKNDMEEYVKYCINNVCKSPLEN